MTASRIRGTRACTVVALAVALSIIAVPGRSSALPTQRPIQPGAQVRIGSNLCTLNFVFSSGSERYIGTAGHCTSSVNQRASTTATGEFGTVVFRRYNDTLDFALIRIDAGKLGQMEPSVRDYGGPTGVTSSSDVSTGDLLAMTGYGIVVESSPLTRPRPGVLITYGSSRYTMDAPAVNGDSGGPVLHRETGKALGIISLYGFSQIPPTTDVGPTVAYIRAQLAAADFNVSIVTATFEG